MRLLPVILLILGFSNHSLANGECDGSGSKGCWASACVFTPEALFINDKARDGFRRAEYIIPDQGKIQYRTLRYHDADCTRVEKSEISDWMTDSKDFTKTGRLPVNNSLTVEEVSFGPFAFGNQPKAMVYGRFYLLENRLLCTSPNILYGEDGPGLNMQEGGPGDGAQMRRHCLHRIDKLITPPKVDLIGKVVPPYPQGFISWQGSCIRESGDPTQGCSHTIGILESAADNQAIGIFGGKFDHYQNEFAAWKITDHIPYPAVPEGYSFTYYGCELNGTPDETIVAVLKSAEQEWLGEAIWAKKLEFNSGKFVDVNLTAVKCMFEGMGEGYY